MAPRIPPPTCQICSQTFSQKSSLVRHAKRCGQRTEGPTRQKACRDCTVAKARCDLERPQCGRCKARSIECSFHRRLPPTTSSIARSSTSPVRSQHNDSDATEPETFVNGRHSSMTSWDLDDLPDGITAESVNSQQRSRAMLQKPHSTTSTRNPVAEHAMFLVIRVLRSWVRMMGNPETIRYPPIIHHMQVERGLPLPLAYCCVLLKMWHDAEDDSSKNFVKVSALKEIRRLLSQHHTYSGLDLLAATQAILLISIILFFGDDNHDQLLAHPLDAQLLIDTWDAKARLAGTGLFLPEEVDGICPSWTEWAIVSAKRRTILAMHHLEWAWSLRYGYPILLCLELGPLPAPAPGYLWQEKDEQKWRQQYGVWLAQWKDGFYRMEEFAWIKPGYCMSERSEMFLAEVDEYGMLVMAEGMTPEIEIERAVAEILTVGQ